MGVPLNCDVCCRIIRWGILRKRICYSRGTTAFAHSLSWSSPALTHYKGYLFHLSQSQFIYSCSWIPDEMNENFNSRNEFKIFSRNSEETTTFFKLKLFTLHCRFTLWMTPLSFHPVPFNPTSRILGCIMMKNFSKQSADFHLISPLRCFLSPDWMYT